MYSLPRKWFIWCESSGLSFDLMVTPHVSVEFKPFKNEIGKFFRHSLKNQSKPWKYQIGVTQTPFFWTRSRGRNSRLRIGPVNPSDVDWLWSNLKFFGKCQRPHFHEFHTVMPMKVSLFHTAVIFLLGLHARCGYIVAWGEVRRFGKSEYQCATWPISRTVRGDPGGWQGG